MQPHRLSPPALVCPTHLGSPTHLFHNPACSLLGFPSPLSSAHRSQGPRGPASSSRQCPPPTPVPPSRTSAVSARTYLAPLSGTQRPSWLCPSCLLSAPEEMGLSPPPRLRKGAPHAPQNAPPPHWCPLPRNGLLSVLQLLTFTHVQGERQWTTINLVFPERTWQRAGSESPWASRPPLPGSAFRSHILPV